MGGLAAISNLISKLTPLNLPTLARSLSELRLPRFLLALALLSLGPRGFDKEEADCDFEQKFSRTDPGGLNSEAQPIEYCLPPDIIFDCVLGEGNDEM